MDILGFILILAIFTAPPAWAREALSRLRDTFRMLRERLPGYEAIIRSILVKHFLVGAVLVTFFEVVWRMGLTGTQLIHERLPYYTGILIWGQLALAIWNYAWGRLTRQNFSLIMHPLCTLLRSQLHAMDPAPRAVCVWLFNNVLSRSPKLAAPYLWLMLVAATTLVQGWDFQLQAIGLPYGDAQKFIALGFASKLVCGFITVVVGTVASLMIRKGTRFVETVSTLAAKMGVGGLPGITIPDALKEIGGAIDILDEAYLAAFVDFLVNSPFLPFIFWDVAVFLWPHAYIAKLAFSGIVIVGALAWIFARKNDATRAEVAKDLEMSNRISFKLSVPMVAVVMTVGMFLEQTVIGRNFKDGVLHAWYGVTSYAFGPWWQYILPSMLAAAIAVAVWRGWKALLKAKKDNADTYKSTVYAYSSISTLFVWIAAGSVSALAICAGIASCWEMRPLHMDPQMVKGAVGMHDLITDNRDGVVTVDFWTAKPARGVVELMDAVEVKKQGLPSYVPLLTTDERHQNYHRVQILAPNYRDTYRIVMRNADETSSEYGKVETFMLDKPLRNQGSSSAVNQGFGAKLLRALGYESAEKQDVPSTRAATGRDRSAAQAQENQPMAQRPAKPCPTLIPIPGFR